MSDFENTDCVFYTAQNVETSSPRLVHDLQDAVNRGVKILTFNLLRERALERFVNPQVARPGGDIAALCGVCKALIEADDARNVSAEAHMT